MTVAASPSHWFSPPQLARQLGVDPSKVVSWIHSGELEAVNVAKSLGGRPRYRIGPVALERFLQRRSTARSPKPVRRRKRAGGYVPKYFQ
jgi:excisionase family DNA binding protein